MSELGKMSDRKVFFAASVVLALILAFAGYRALRRSAGLLLGDFFYPYLALTRIVSDTAARQSLLLLSRTELASKTESLIQENRRLKAENQQLRNLASENRELRILAHLPASPQWSYAPAQVLLRDPLFWREKFTVSIEPDSGIFPGAVVLAPTGDGGEAALVGVVSRVGKRNAEVETIFSRNLRLSVAFPGGGNGFLNAGERRALPGTIPVGYIPVNRGAAPGDPAVTTGFSAGIPSGLKVGHLTTLDEVNPNFSSTEHVSGLLTPELDFDNLRFVLIAIPDSGSGARP